MKKLALLLVGILIGFLICYYFFPAQEVTVAEVEQDPPAPKGLITSKNSEQLDRAYNARYDAVNVYLESESGEQNFKDNRSSWYSIDDVEKYLAYAKNEATNLGYEMNGIRIYLGAKNPESGQKVGYTTMFIVSTGNKKNSKGSMFNMSSSLFQPSPPDIPGGSGLDDGGNGNPPNGNYPQ